MPRAAMDLGSNSILLTVVGDEGEVLHDEARVVGLGKGLGDRGLFATERMKAAEVVLGEYLHIARGHGVEPWQVKAVATSAARRAMNAQTWVGRLQRKLGLRVQIVTGEEEAQLTWLGAQGSLALPEGDVLVVDLGGGSTELVLGSGGEVSSRVSLELGSARLTERYLGCEVVDPAQLTALRQDVALTVSSFALEQPPAAVVGVAGTVTTLAAMARGITDYDADLVHGSELSRVELGRFVDQLLPATPQERRAMAAVAPDRADSLLAGCAVLDRILAMSRRSSMIVSDRGLRYGLLTRPGRSG